MGREQFTKKQQLALNALERALIRVGDSGLKLVGMNAGLQAVDGNIGEDESPREYVDRAADVGRVYVVKDRTNVYIGINGAY